jgi:hypothetical protein
MVRRGLASPRSVALGDVRLAGLTAAALGWLGWQQVLLGQALIAILAVLTAAVVAIATQNSAAGGCPSRWGRR